MSSFELSLDLGLRSDAGNQITSQSWCSVIESQVGGPSPKCVSELGLELRLA